MRVYKFSNFRLDPQEGVLYKDSLPVQLAPKAFDTLLALVSRPGQLVSKETLMQEIWGDLCVEENNLTQHIFTLRRILSQEKSGLKFIETVPRKGYRFTAEVKIYELPDSATGGSDFETVSWPNDGSSENVRRPTPSPPPAFPRRRSSPTRVLGYGLIVITILISLGFALHYKTRRESFTARFAEFKFKRVTETGNLLGAAISPDGSSLAYVTREDKCFWLKMKNMATASEIVVYRAPEDVSLAGVQFSPDGNFIYFGRGKAGEQGAIYRIPVFGGETSLVAENVWSGFSVAPDNRRVAFPRAVPSEKKSSIVVAHTDGSGEQTVAEITGNEFFALWGPAPTWSPDGERVTAIAGEIEVDAGRLIEIDLINKTSRRLEIEGDFHEIEAIRWTSENELVMAAKGKDEEIFQLWRINFPDGKPERLTNDFNSYVGFSFDRNLHRMTALARTDNFHLWLFDRQTGATRRLTSGTNRVDGVSGLVFAPDGEIIFAARRENERNIFSLNPESGQIRQLTKNMGRTNYHPDISPDNSRIAFISRKSGPARIWTMNRDGSHTKLLTPNLTDNKILQVAPKFSPNGKWIYFWTLQPGNARIYKISADGRDEPVLISDPQQSDASPAVSPDGKWMSFFSYDDRTTPPWRVGIRSLNKSEIRYFNIQAGRQLTGWLPDSKSIVSIDYSDGGNLWQTNIETGARLRITNFQAERVDNFAVSPDGSQIALACGNSFTDAVLIER